MPLHLRPLDVSKDLEGVRSVLIVSCPVCPSVSLAIETASPFIEVSRRGLTTRAFQDHIAEIRESLEQHGIRTAVLSMYIPVPTMCLWTQGQRKRLLKHAKDFEAVLVLGCDSAKHTVQRALNDADCRVVLAMRMTGITNATTKLRFPMTVSLEETTCVDLEERSSAEAP